MDFNIFIFLVFVILKMHNFLNNKKLKLVDFIII